MTAYQQFKEASTGFKLLVSTLATIAVGIAFVLGMRSDVQALKKDNTVIFKILRKSAATLATAAEAGRQGARTDKRHDKEIRQIEKNQRDDYRRRRGQRGG